MALYLKNSRMTRGDFQMWKYILPPNCKGKVGFPWSWGSYATIYRNCSYTHAISYVRGKMAAYFSDWGASETWTGPLRILCLFFCQCNSNCSKMQEMSLLLLNIYIYYTYKRMLLKHSPITNIAIPDQEHQHKACASHTVNATSYIMCQCHAAYYAHCI